MVPTGLEVDALITFKEINKHRYYIVETKQHINENQIESITYAREACN